MFETCDVSSSRTKLEVTPSHHPEQICRSALCSLCVHMLCHHLHTLVEVFNQANSSSLADEVSLFQV